MSKIYDNLYLGNISTSRDESFFKNNFIKNVLIAAKNLQRSFLKICKYYQLQISDNPTTIILKFWPESMEFLSQAVGNTLVHCQGGKSRSASTVMAFVMFKENITADEAIIKVRKLHKFAYPNAGFLKQLEYWKTIPIKSQKEDFKLLEQITSVKLNEVSSSIIKPSQHELALVNQKFNFVEVLEDPISDKKNVKLMKNNKKLERENQAIKNKLFKNDIKNEDEDENEENQGDNDEDYLDEQNNEQGEIKDIQNQLPKNNYKMKLNNQLNDGDEEEEEEIEEQKVNRQD